MNQCNSSSQMLELTFCRGLLMTGFGTFSCSCVEGGFPEIAYKTCILFRSKMDLYDCCRIKLLSGVEMWIFNELHFNEKFTGADCTD